MALNWQWSEKCGEMLFRGEEGNEYTLSLYEGNAFLIMLYEYKDEIGEDYYDMWSFWVDEAHAKNCLGLSKGYDNIYHGEVVSVTFYRSYLTISKIHKLSKLLVAAFPKVRVESIYGRFSEDVDA